MIKEDLALRTSIKRRACHQLFQYEKMAKHKLVGGEEMKINEHDRARLAVLASLVILVFGLHPNENDLS